MKRVMESIMRLVGKRTCEDVVAVLQDYFDGRLEPRLSTLITRHLQGCPDCDAFARSYGATIKLTGELQCEDIPEEVQVRVRQALRERIAAGR